MSQPSSSQPRWQAGEMGALIEELRELLQPLPRTTRAIPLPEPSNSFAPDSPVASAMILEADTAVELGHPRTDSAWCTLLTWHAAHSDGWRVSIVGPDAPDLAAGERRPLGIVLLLAFRPGCEADPLVVDRLPFLPLGLPDVMVRSVPGRTWIRMSRKGSRVRSLIEVGTTWLRGCASRVPGLEGAEIVFVTSSEHDVQALRPIAAQARLLASEHRKLVLTGDGGIECADATCGTCEDKPVCDGIRDILARRRHA